MQKVFLFLLFFSVKAFSGQFTLHPGENITIDQHTVSCVSNSTSLPSCSESCQYYDSFNGKCLFKTTCDYSEQCVIFTNCDQWDSFNKKCITTKKTIQCRNLKICEETCQYYDNFNKKCHYYTKCESIGPCMKNTLCEKWDSFNHQCNSEKTETVCN